MEYFVAMEAFATLLLLMYVFAMYIIIIGPINVCANFEINRYNIDEFSFSMFHLMSRDAKTVRRCHSGSDTSDRYCNQSEISTTPGSRIMFWVTLTYIFIS